MAEDEVSEPRSDRGGAGDEGDVAREPGAGDVPGTEGERDLPRDRGAGGERDVAAGSRLAALDARLPGGPLSADERLLAWAGATVAASVVVLAGVLAAHAADALAGVLQSLSTLLGVAAFLYLWAATYVAVRWAVSAMDVRSVSARGAAVHAVAAGALVGMAAVLGAILAAGFPLILVEPEEIPAILLFVAIGLPIGAVGGAVVGLAVGLVAVGCDRLARAVAPVE